MRHLFGNASTYFNINKIDSKWEDWVGNRNRHVTVLVARKMEKGGEPMGGFQQLSHDEWHHAININNSTAHEKNAYNFKGA